MNRDMFMKELEFLLQDIADEDKLDALQYYRDYFDEAGPEEEENIIKGLGSPERIAAMIRTDLNGNLEEGGEFTDSGYQDERFKDPNYQVAKRLDLPEEKGASAQKSKVGTDGAYEDLQGKRPIKGDGNYRKQSGIFRAVLIVLLIIFGMPLALGAGGAAIGFLAAIVGVLAALFLGLGALTLAFGLAGIVLIVVAIVNAPNPWAAVMSAGAGLIAFGVCFLCLAVSVLFYGKLMPALIRMAIDPLNRLVNRRRGL